MSFVSSLTSHTFRQQAADTLSVAESVKSESKMSSASMVTQANEWIDRHPLRYKSAHELDHFARSSDIAWDGHTGTMTWKIVTSIRFDMAVACFLILNVALLGAQTHYMAIHAVVEPPFVFLVIDMAFCALFSCELGFRLVAFRKRFFTCGLWRWNVFDLIVVSMHIAEVILWVAVGKLTQDPKESMFDGAGNVFESLQVLRVLRLIRVVRVIRILRAFHELRALVVSLCSSCGSLIWALCLLLALVYMVGIIITQLVTEFIVGNPGAREYEASLLIHWGSLDRSVISLFQAVSGGLDWGETVDPLIEHISPWLVVLVYGYVALAEFGILNIVTGIFVESAKVHVRKAEEIFLLQQMHSMFCEVDTDASGDISWEEFESQLNNPRMKTYFKAVELAPEEAAILFKLIDIDESGFISPEEFVNGCVHLRGPAKAIDLAALLHENKRNKRDIDEKIHAVDATLATVVEHVKQSGNKETQHVACTSSHDKHPNQNAGTRSMEDQVIVDDDVFFAGPFPEEIPVRPDSFPRNTSP